MNKKIIITIICIFLVVSGIILVKSIGKGNYKTGNNELSTNKEIFTSVQKAVMINNKIYVETENKIDIKKCGVCDGKIDKQVERNTMPTQNNESNFGIDILYQIIDDNNIDLRLDEGWIRFTKI